MAFRIVDDPHYQSQEAIPEVNSQGRFRIVDEAPKTSDVFDQIAPEETSMGTIGRHLARTGTRAVETLGGLPGDIASIPERLIPYLAEKITQKSQPELRESFKAARKSVPIVGQLPTSSELRDLSRQISSGYTEPKTKIESLADDIASDTVSLMIPVKGKVPFMRSLITSTAANLAGEGVKQLGGSEKATAGTKLGALFLSSFIGRNGIRGADKYVDNLYKQAEKAIPEGAKTSAGSMVENLGNLKTKLSKGTLAPSEKAVVDEIDTILEKVKGGKIEAQELQASKRSLSEKMGKFLYETPEKAAKARARKLFGKVKQEINSPLQEYGKTNPEFYKPYLEAEQGFATLAQSRRTSEFIKKYAKIASPYSIAGAVTSLFANPMAFAKGAVGAGIGTGILKSSEMAYQIAKSPALRRHYMNILNAAIQEDAVTMNRNLKELSDKIEREGITPQEKD